MNEAKRVSMLKRECLRLFKLRNDYKKYKEEVIKLDERVINLKLNHTIDSGYLQYILLKPMFENKLLSPSHEKFKTMVDDSLKVKQTDFYFQLSELRDFPDNYRLGYGVVLIFNSLPKPVKILAENLYKGKIVNRDKEIERILKVIVKEMVIPQDPHIGCWLKITTSAISYNIRLNNAFQFAEESVDILRIATPIAKVHLPQYAIAKNANEGKGYFATNRVEFNKYFYNSRIDKLVDKLNSICTRPSSDLEKRIKNALHFVRIGDNHSPGHQRLFFYVAAIENLILGDKDKDVLRWKISEKGAILSVNNLNQRLELAEKLKKLYDKRSTIAHGGKSEYDPSMTEDARNLLQVMIMKVLELIDTYGLRTVLPDRARIGKSLDEYLDNIIYS